MTHTSAVRSSIRPGWMLVAAGIIFSASLVTAASAPPDRPVNPVHPAGPGVAQAAKPPVPPVKDMTADEEYAWATDAEVTTNTLCSSCHPIAEITGTRHTWPEWNDTVTRMAALGISATDAQLTTVRLYMTRYYGAVNVNTAPAPEISAVLGLSSKVAAAVVEYRKAHGNFADAAALLNVEGVDKSKIEEQPGAIRFN